jgi:hypothetical protein
MRLIFYAALQRPPTSYVDTMTISTADERQAALQALYACRDARDASELDSDAYREQEQKYQRAQVFYWNLGHAKAVPVGSFFAKFKRWLLTRR